MARGRAHGGQAEGWRPPSHRIEAQRAVILDAIAAQPDITLAELATMLKQEHGAWFKTGSHVRPS